MSLSIFRRFHTARPARNLGLTSLRQQIEAKFTQEAKVSDEETLNALRACSNLEQQYRQSSQPDSPLSQTSPDQAKDLLKTVLTSPNVKLDEKILHDFFITNPHPSPAACIEAMKRYQRQTFKAVPERISLIPFRYAVYNADFTNAFKLMDAAVNTTQYRHMVSRAWKKFGGYWALGAGSVLSGVELLLQSGLVGVWESTGMVHMMVLTYLTSITVYGGLAFGGRYSGNGDVLKWIQGTVTSHQFSHSAEMRLCSRIADVNRALPENQNECSLQLRRELRERYMAVVELEQEELLKEYWAKGGEGFEWVEPDQDPAEIVWRERMDKTRNKRLGSPYSKQPNENYEWADQVVKETLPHASLIQNQPKMIEQ